MMNQQPNVVSPMSMMNQQPNVVSPMSMMNQQPSVVSPASMPNQGPVSPYSFPGSMPKYPTFPGLSAQVPPQWPSGGPMPPQFPGMQAAGTAAPAVTLPAFERSYIENILRLNLGKMATVYMTFENNSQWNAKVFKGRVEAAGRDHIIISDPQTGMRYLLLMVNLDYITFDEELNYEYPIAAPAATAAGR